ncbi:pirin family protein [Rhodospirillaceae bacterium SYSU D60014]|uniref:pirin family protein n=1 Tax=Virgifigura deserti TaxID=2268457 RepID=UPI000E66BAA7
MIAVRKADERGVANFGWLNSRHSFSFGHYHDPAHMGFRSLRVINEDRVVPGAGFDTHGHRDMEIISYVLDGALAHKDSLGTGSTIRPGEVQRMSAGTGIRHSEFNASKTEPVHFLQIWILPERDSLDPGYEQREFPLAEKKGRLRLVASRDGRDGSVTMHQDADLYASVLAAGETVTHRLAPGRHGWLQVARGTVTLNGESLAQGDGAAISDLRDLAIAAQEDSEVLLFDLE